jgi:hypothetical protein
VVFAGCHWMAEQMDKSKLSASSQSSDEVENDKQYLRTNVIDVFGKETEPICDYLRCHRWFSDGGLVFRTRPYT